jgi:hypothetical protein
MWCPCCGVGFPVGMTKSKSSGKRRLYRNLKFLYICIAFFLKKVIARNFTYPTYLVFLGTSILVFFGITRCA